MNQQTQYVRPRGQAAVRGLPLLQPVSREGQSADPRAALPDLGVEGATTLMAVGSVRMYHVYRYNFDARNQRGSWAFQYSIYDGELAS
jgi:hypothetical protein